MKKVEEEKTSWNPSEDGPKVSVEYVLPYHQEDLDTALQAPKVRLIISLLLEAIRTSAKYGADFHGKSVRKDDGTAVEGPLGHSELPYDYDKIEMLEAVRDYLLEEAQARGIDLSNF